MNWLELACFLPLAVLCNTALPLSFDPVLIYFASGQSSRTVCALALIGSVCAGIAAVADVTVLRRLRTKNVERWLKWMPASRGLRFYCLTFVFALSPLPFSIVRLAVLRRSPETVPYAFAVALGRLPRYLLTVSLWPVLGFPSHSPEILMWASLAFTILQFLRLDRSNSEQPQR